MDDRTKPIFLREVQRQISFAEIATEEMMSITESVISNSVTDPEKMQTLFWYAAQNLLISLANISKVLYPSKKYYRRGDALRKELSLPVENVFKSRLLRNSFEHFDERIEEFFMSATKGKGSIFIDTNMVEIKITGLDMPIAYMRNYLPSERTLYFQDVKLNLDTVQTELNELKEKLNKLIKSAE
ncbi:hypothetical protein [Paenibacillus segetis]|uniref:Uncharacterized protein n=1 Tax=Paenibacillus segetis TaxID=1325360 RepID=A0ABQ1Y9Z5_9BACL|nr:hypothetical protein [Paenibacillus segetis]GGH17392.1 hypothetical protein GCM10008013_12690 [Paenibacillus segetis]